VRYAEANPLAVLNPLLILAVPLFDTAFVSVVRLRRRQSPFHGSPDHFALRLRKHGWPVGRILAASAGTTAVTGILALVNMGLGAAESLSIYMVVAALALGIALYLGRIRMP